MTARPGWDRDRGPSDSRDDSRERSPRRWTQTDLPNIGPDAQNMEALCRALVCAQTMCYELDKKCCELDREVGAMKTIIRQLLFGRRRDMNWYNHYGGPGGGEVDRQSNAYWHEREELITVYNHVLAHDNWQDAWDQENAQAAVNAWEGRRPAWIHDLAQDRWQGVWQHENAEAVDGAWQGRRPE